MDTLCAAVAVGSEIRDQIILDDTKKTPNARQIVSLEQTTLVVQPISQPRTSSGWIQAVLGSYLPTSSIRIFRLMIDDLATSLRLGSYISMEERTGTE